MKKMKCRTKIYLTIFGGLHTLVTLLLLTLLCGGAGREKEGDEL